ncbi:MAG: LarC family nickel insertion protein [Chloroflexi bacterium]|nr:LarC family nickel insertion protein [Chloroflexota bacterium]
MGQTVVFFDCFSGASGDMLLSALLDAGFELKALHEGIGSLGLSSDLVTSERAIQHGITATTLTVHDPHDSQPARSLPAVRRLLAASGLSERVTGQSLAVFTAIAEVEGAIHGLAPDEVHFHELSAVDSLVDIVGFALALEALGIEKVYASPLPLGLGMIHIAHGMMPLPAAATLALLARAQAPTIPSSAQIELVTPTGAGLLGSLAEFRQPAMRIQKVGYGMGKKELPWANVVRVWIGEELDLPPARHTPVSSAHTHSHTSGSDHIHAHDHDHAHGHAHTHAHDHKHGHDHPHSH